MECPLQILHKLELLEHVRDMVLCVLVVYDRVKQITEEMIMLKLCWSSVSQTAVHVPIVVLDLPPGNTPNESGNFLTEIYGNYIFMANYSKIK